MPKRPTATLQIHYDGDLIDNHQIPMRTLGKSIHHLQKALDRAYLDIKHDGGVWKYARMTQDDYARTEFLVQTPEEGGYVLKFLSRIPIAGRVVDRVSNAINEASNVSEVTKTSIQSQVENRKNQLVNNIVKPIEFRIFLEQPSAEVIREYGDRSIAKEIDQVLSIIRAEYAGNSQFELILTGSATQTFFFDKQRSRQFHEIVSKRKLGPPVIYRGVIEELDRKNRKGKFLNSVNGRRSILHLSTQNDFLLVHPYLANDQEFQFIGSPLIEFGALEPNSGDIYFLQIIEPQAITQHHE